MPLNTTTDALKTGTVLTVRAYSGIAGDMMLSGLIRMTGIGGEGLQKRLAAIMPDLSGSAVLEPASVQHIAGWRLRVSLPHQHEHRTLADCEKIIAASGMDTGARETALAAFRLVAGAEGRVHGAKPEEVHFHEVGALDSILDICLASQLFHELNPGRFVVSPLPVCDGSIPSQSHGRGIRAVAGHADRAYGPRLWKYGLSRRTQWRALCLRCLIVENGQLFPIPAALRPESFLRTFMPGASLSSAFCSSSLSIPISRIRTAAARPVSERGSFFRRRKP